MDVNKISEVSFLKRKRRKDLCKVSSTYLRKKKTNLEKTEIKKKFSMENE